MKIGFLITARLKSSRLPFKVVKDLNGKSVIERIIDRAKQVYDISEIVLCTSINSQDKPLVDIAKNNNIYYYCGSEEDVLKRLLTASELFNLDYFVAITADNPFFSIYYANRIVDEIKRKKSDYIKIEGLPLGAAPYSVKVKALKTVCKIKNIVDTEIWGILLNKPNIFDVNILKANDELNRPNLRLTLDYESDYKLINKVYSSVEFNEIINLYNVIDYLDCNPDVKNINSNCIQKELPKKIKNEIDEYYKNNEDFIKQIKKNIYIR